MTHNFGQKLRELRISKRLSQPDLEDDTGIDRRNISQLERGERKPSEGNLKALSKVFSAEEMLELKRAHAKDVMSAKRLGDLISEIPEYANAKQVSDSLSAEAGLAADEALFKKVDNLPIGEHNQQVLKRIIKSFLEDLESK